MSDTPIPDFHPFLHKIIAQGQIWGLSSEEGWATSVSNEYEETEVLPFWTSEENAKQLAQDEWARFTPKSITISEFLENWLIGMHNDEILVGLEWNEDLQGHEFEPMELALEIIAQLKSQGKQLEFVKFENLEDMEQQIQWAISEEGDE